MPPLFGARGSCTCVSARDQLPCEPLKHYIFRLNREEIPVCLTMSLYRMRYGLVSESIRVLVTCVRELRVEVELGL